MAQNQNPRRYYIDRNEDHAVVRAVQVQRIAASPATHQVEPPVTQESPDFASYMAPAPSRSHANRQFRQPRQRGSVASLLAPNRVGKLVRSARNRAKQIPS